MTTIAWTEKTWNPVTGCSPVSAGCVHCYAAAMSHRLSSMGQSRYHGLTSIHANGCRHFNGNVCCHEDQLGIPLRRKKPTMWFVNSMSDTFHPQVPFEFIDKLFAVMALCPQHTFQILTKRPEQLSEYYQNDPQMRTTRVIGQRICDAYERKTGTPMAMKADRGAIVTEWPLNNVWLGTSVENQAAADERIPHLLKCSAAIRFLSVEPMLEPVTLREVHSDVCEIDALTGNHGVVRPLQGRSDARVHWVIIGGESGPKARPFNLEWAYDLIDQCRAAGVAVFMKQIGSQARLQGEPYPRRHPVDRGKRDNPFYWRKDLQIREYPQP